jgi:hypothetical protein
MKLAHLLIFVAFLPLLAFAEPAADAKAREAMLGVWVGTEVRPGAEVKGTTELKQDGTFELSAIVKRNGNAPLLVQAGGVWKVEDGYMVQVIARTTNEALAPVGLVTRDKIVGVSGTELQLRSEEGRPLLRIRQ